MRGLDRVFAWIVLALGIIHICVTPLVYSSFNQGALWFAGADLAGLFAGMLNLIRSATPALFLHFEAAFGVGCSRCDLNAVRPIFTAIRRRSSS
jgi:hypothetical protein